MRSPSPFRGRSAFSLIEILVTLGIVAVLATLIAANAGKLGAKADAVTCSSNLRQMFLHLNNYAQENNGVYPAAVEAGTGRSWWLVLTTFMNAPEQIPAVGKKTIFACPAARNTYPGKKVNRTYAMNIFENFDFHTPCRITANSKPSQTIFIMDSCTSPAKSGDGIHYLRASNFAANAEARHSGKMNALYFDGHVAAVSIDASETVAQVQNLGK
jgi:prepilin-type processing-associated H-X9-DG protein/prepilin-type N-terminal cleavage/methylation domain-containing protein